MVIKLFCGIIESMQLYKGGTGMQAVLMNIGVFVMIGYFVYLAIAD